MEGQFTNRKQFMRRPMAGAMPVSAPTQDAIPLSNEPGHEVLWNGVFYGFSGYAKANREIILRLANSFRVAITHAIDLPPPDAYTKMRVDQHTRVAVTDKAPLVRFFGPWAEKKRHIKRTARILYTMMETERVHPTMIGLMNDNYDEIWTPTAWNATAFKESGLKLPTRVMPLAVDPYVFSAHGPAWLPACRLLTTEYAGADEVPEAEFIFIYVFLPSFRKDAAMLLDAFQEAFAGDPRTGLILCVTHNRAQDKDLETLRPKDGSPVWVLRGEYTEHDLAAFYRSCNGYVCTSRGEGWNLPMCEAAACGLPVIVPRSSCHQDVALDDALYFDPEGWEIIEGASKISPWYEGMPWPIHGAHSRAQLVSQLRAARRGNSDVTARAARFTKRLRTETTWDHAARNVAARLVEVQA